MVENRWTKISFKYTEPSEEYYDREMEILPYMSCFNWKIL